MVELVDSSDLGSDAKSVWVRVPVWAPLREVPLERAEDVGTTNSDSKPTRCRVGIQMVCYSSSQQHSTVTLGETRPRFSVYESYSCSPLQLKTGCYL